MELVFNLKMFDNEHKVIVVDSCGYESILKHSHEFIEMTYVVSGTGINTSGEGAVELKRHDLMMLTKEVSHNIRPTCGEDEFKIINIIFPEEVAALDIKKFAGCNIINLGESGALTELIYTIRREYAERKPYSDVANIGYVNQLLAETARLIDGTARRRESADIINSQYVNSVVEYIHGNFHRKMALDEICAHAGLSRGYVQKLFRTKRNTTVIEYLQRYRIEQACKLLLGNEHNVSEICELVGFSDLKNFYTTFKKLIGTTPKNYRTVYGGSSGNRVGIDKEGRSG
jgi:AraC-like DNA-binding protein/mannose-6-phosphate isomerase-like protein (cupin superfamily)